MALKKQLSARPVFSAWLVQFRQAAIGRRIVRDGAWVAGGQIVSAVAALVSIRIMTELLAPKEFGRLTLLVGIVALALGLASTPRLQAIIRYYPDAARESRIGNLRRIGVRLIAPLVAITAALLVATWFVAGPWLDGAWFTGLLVATLLVIDCLRSFELSLLNSARRQREASLIYVADAWSRPLMAVAAVLAFGPSADAALAGYITGSAAVVCAMRVCMRLEGLGQNAPEHDDTELAAGIRRYAWPLAPLAVFGWFSGMGDRYIIAGLLSLQDAGLYAAAYALASRPFLMLSGVVELTMRPVLQNAVAAEDAALVARTKTAWLLIMIAGAAFGVICFALLSEWVGRLLLAEQYRSATNLMPWIAIGYALYVVSNVFSRFCYIFDNTQAVLFLTVAGATIGLPIMIPAIIYWGLFGATLAVVVRFGIEVALSMPLARRAERRFVSLRSRDGAAQQ